MTEFEEYIAYWYREMLTTRKKIRETEAAKARVEIRNGIRLEDAQKRIADLFIKGE